MFDPMIFLRISKSSVLLRFMISCRAFVPHCVHKKRVNCSAYPFNSPLRFKEIEKSFRLWTLFHSVEQNWSFCRFFALLGVTFSPLDELLECRAVGDLSLEGDGIKRYKAALSGGVCNTFELSHNLILRWNCFSNFISKSKHRGYSVWDVKVLNLKSIIIHLLKCHRILVLYL